MERANEHIRNKEWQKGTELFTDLLNKSNNKETIIACLLGRSQCAWELRQYEAVVKDCIKIIELAENKDATSIHDPARSRLVHALFAQQRYGDAEAAAKEWFAVSKSSEASKFLEQLHVVMHGTQKALLDKELPKYYWNSKSEMQQTDLVLTCIYCNITCQDKSELRAHCQTESHQTIIMSDKGKDWQWRPPPRGMNAETYTLCSNWEEKQSCRFGEQCVEAHGLEELVEWRERYKYRQMKLQRAYEKELFGKSYTEQLIEKCMQASNPKLVLLEKVDYVHDTCCSGLVTAVLFKASAKEWKFTLVTNRLLHAIALLHDVHRSYFEIKQVLIISSQNKTELEVKNKQECIFGLKETPQLIRYQVTVSFRSDIYGTFRQSVVFDFGCEPVLVKNLCVDVIPSEEAQKLNEIRQEIILTSAERWSESNADIIPFTSENLPYCFESSYDKDFNKMYPCPQTDTFNLSHETVTEKRLTKNNYRVRMHELLYIEEMARNEQTYKYNITAKLHVVKSYLLSSSSGGNSTAKYSYFGELFAFMNLNQDLSEDTLCGRLILNNCTSVLIGVVKQESNEKPKVYEALIEDKGKNVIYLHLSAVTVEELRLLPDTSFQAQIQFRLNRTPYCEWHYSVDKMTNLQLIFPDTYLEPLIPWSPQKQWSDCVDKCLNVKQREAVIAITTPLYISLPPILIIGPFGTGKTFTLAQAIRQLMKQSNTKVLICTHSNSAADLYIKDFLHPCVESGYNEARPLRIYYQKRWVSTVHRVVQQYCLIQDSGGIRTFLIPTLADIEKHRIIVVTLSTSIYLSNLGLPHGYFTHILLDEAAQTIECEAIMPLSFADQNTRIVLAGDHMQLSPELFSQFAKERNLHISLLERLYDHYPSNFPCKILLCENYRAHEAIIEFTSELFYDQKLIASGKQPRHQQLYPLTFFTARGEDVQDVNSTTFYNSSEAYEVVERVSELKKQWPKCWGKFDEQSIGIMTPYADQVFRIRSELRKRRLGTISVERVLNVQGKQFRAVFLSTVRTRRTCTISDGTKQDGDYGFLSNSKLLNTAITRAQSLIAVVGDPVALCSVGRCSKVWERFIQICDNNKSLFGITWSFLKNQLDGLELKKTYGLNPLAPEFIPRNLKTEAYIKVPQLTPSRNGYAQHFYTGYTITRPSMNVYNTESNVPMMWPIPYYQPSNYVWRLPPVQQQQSVASNPPEVQKVQTNEIAISSQPPSQPQPQPMTPIVVPSNSPICRPTGIPTNPRESLSQLPLERDLIQFLDNVHIPQGFKNNSDSLHDLMNLLPENMSLANVLMQPPTFHRQWFNYLLAKKGIEAAKKFEYLMLMSTKKERTVDMSLMNFNKTSIDWELLCSDMLKYNINDRSNVPYLEQQTPDLNWFDKPINQINFDKPVYLKDPLHMDNLQQKDIEDEFSSQSNISKSNLSNRILIYFDKRQSTPLYLRQPSTQNNFHHRAN